MKFDFSIINKNAITYLIRVASHLKLHYPKLIIDFKEKLLNADLESKNPILMFTKLSYSETINDKHLIESERESETRYKPDKTLHRCQLYEDE
jgi:hypothetical protein